MWANFFRNQWTHQRLEISNLVINQTKLISFYQFAMYLDNFLSSCVNVNARFVSNQMTVTDNVVWQNFSYVTFTPEQWKELTVLTKKRKCNPTCVIIFSSSSCQISKYPILHFETKNLSTTYGVNNGRKSFSKMILILDSTIKTNDSSQVWTLSHIHQENI